MVREAISENLLFESQAEGKAAWYVRALWILYSSISFSDCAFDVDFNFLRDHVSEHIDKFVQRLETCDTIECYKCQHTITGDIEVNLKILDVFLNEFQVI